MVFNYLSWQMQYRVIILSIFCFSLSLLSAQEKDEQEAINLVYLEAGGFGGFGSLNYERLVFTKDYFQVGSRLGLGLNRFKDFRNKFNPDISIPIGVNFAYGTRIKGEIGIGTTYTNIVHAGPSLGVERSSEIHGNLLIGVRFQKRERGALFRLGYSPIFEKFSKIRHWPYISFGWSL